MYTLQITFVGCYKSLNRKELEAGAADMDASAELLDLQKRFQLLEVDRKAFYEQSQRTLRQNKKVSDALRCENKQLRAELSAIQKERGSAASDGCTVQEVQSAEVAKLEATLNQLRQRANQLSAANRSREKTLAAHEDDLRVLKRATQRPSKESSPLKRQVGTLESRIETATLKYNEALSDRKTYAHIIKRLKADAVNFDSQLAAIEALLRAKAQDYEEVRLMAHEASHANSITRAELAKLRLHADEGRRKHQVAKCSFAMRARQEMGRQEVDARSQEGDEAGCSSDPEARDGLIQQQQVAQEPEAASDAGSDAAPRDHEAGGEAGDACVDEACDEAGGEACDGADDGACDDAGDDAGDETGDGAGDGAGGEAGDATSDDACNEAGGEACNEASQCRAKCQAELLRLDDQPESCGDQSAIKSSGNVERMRDVSRGNASSCHGNEVGNEVGNKVGNAVGNEVGQDEDFEEGGKAGVEDEGGRVAESETPRVKFEEADDEGLNTTTCIEKNNGVK